MGHFQKNDKAESLHYFLCTKKEKCKFFVLSTSTLLFCSLFRRTFFSLVTKGAVAQQVLLFISLPWFGQLKPVPVLYVIGSLRNRTAGRLGTAE